MGMAKCGDCLYFGMCSHYIDAEESFPEVGGCTVFKRKDAFVEVVRCKDCKHYWLPQGFCTHNRHDHQTMAVWQEADDFCSYGEKGE